MTIVTAVVQGYSGKFFWQVLVLDLCTSTCKTKNYIPSIFKGIHKHTHRNQDLLISFFGNIHPVFRVGASTRCDGTSWELRSKSWSKTLMRLADTRRMSRTPDSARCWLDSESLTSWSTPLGAKFNLNNVQWESTQDPWKSPKRYV